MYKPTKPTWFIFWHCLQNFYCLYSLSKKNDSICSNERNLLHQLFQMRNGRLNYSKCQLSIPHALGSDEGNFILKKNSYAFLKNPFIFKKNLSKIRKTPFVLKKSRMLFWMCEIPLTKFKKFQIQLQSVQLSNSITVSTLNTQYFTTLHFICRLHSFAVAVNFTNFFWIQLRDGASYSLLGF